MLLYIGALAREQDAVDICGQLFGIGTRESRRRQCRSYDHPLFVSYRRPDGGFSGEGKFVLRAVYPGVAINGLSTREKQIVAAVARGLSNRDIAAEAGIAPQTVKNHLSTIFQKCQVRSRVQLAVLALQNGNGEPPG